MKGVPASSFLWPPEISLFSAHAPRTAYEHRTAAKRYLDIRSPHQRDEFVRTRYSEQEPAGYRYSALLRLQYWDGARMMIIDPMHCLFLGKCFSKLHK